MGGDEFSTGAFGDPKRRISGPGLQRTLYSTATGALAGTFYGACVAAWYPDPIQSSKKYGGVPGGSDFRALGRVVGRSSMWFSLAAGTFTAVECLCESFRNDVQDPWNSLAAGMAAGAVIGATTGRAQYVGAAALGVGAAMCAIDMSGPTTVYDEDALNYKRKAMLPRQHVESEAVTRLKELFPQHKDL